MLPTSITSRKTVTPSPETGAAANLPCGFLCLDRVGRVISGSSAVWSLLRPDDPAQRELPPPLFDAVQNLCRTKGLNWLGCSFAVADDKWVEIWLTRFPESDENNIRILISIRSIDHTRRAYRQARIQRRRLALVEEITTALHTTLSLEETLNIILVGVTARQGLGFNRAFVFLCEKDDNWLQGRTAIGPASPAQAGDIWQALAGEGTGGLAEAVCTYRLALDGADAEVNRRVADTRIPYNGPDNPFTEIIDGAAARVIYRDQAGRPEITAVFDRLDAEAIACAPLRSRDRVVGLLLADHRITGDPITPSSLRSLELIAGQAGLAVERTTLSDNLARRVEDLRQARDQLQLSQDIVGRLERYSIVGEIAGEVAHQLRNPLTILGGFARNLRTGKAEDDPDYRGLDIICKQADRMCGIIDSIISVESWEAEDKRPFELALVLRQSIEILKSRFAGNAIKWSCDVRLGDFVLTGRPDALRFTLFKIFSGLLTQLEMGSEVSVIAETIDAGARITVWPQSSDAARGAIISLLQGEWDAHPAQRNLALEYLTAHGGALGLDDTGNGAKLIIDFQETQEEMA